MTTLDPSEHYDGTGMFLQPWSRRAWLTHAATALAVTPAVLRGQESSPRRRRSRREAARMTARVAAQSQLADPAVLETLAQRAVEAAHTAGASYADAQVTRTIQHHYAFLTPLGEGATDALQEEVELLGLGVRVLVDGYWGFSASPLWTPDEAVRLAQEAVAQSKVNAQGKPRTVDLGMAPAVHGRWTTPIQIDPFNISIEEKADMIAYWIAYAQDVNFPAWGGKGQLVINPLQSYLHFARQEQTVATSAGTLISQTFYESGGVIWLGQRGGRVGLAITGLDVAGKGWELVLDAKIPEQLTQAPARIEELKKLTAKPATIGRYTIVCDGAAMAHLVEQTFGIATQLDRALGYEANASGTSYLEDPLGLLGTAQVAAPMVTITANRSAPAELATVKWDTEGVEPEETTLVKNGVLVDFQTTREQAAWLAPYYQKAGKPVRSHGHAAAEDALSITMQHMPNLTMEPGPANVGLTDLISNVQDGILIHDIILDRVRCQTDHQARNGLLQGMMRQIRNGRVGPLLGGEVGILFNTQDLWKHVVAVGGPATQAVSSATAMNFFENAWRKMGWIPGTCKGQPPQLTSHSVRAPAAIITDQALVNQTRRA